MLAVIASLPAHAAEPPIKLGEFLDITGGGATAAETTRHQHQKEARERSGERISDRPPSANDLHQEAGEALSRNALEEYQRTQSKAQRDGGALLDQRFWQQNRNQKIGSPGADATENTDGGPPQLAPAE